MPLTVDQKMVGLLLLLTRSHILTSSCHTTATSRLLDSSSQGKDGDLYVRRLSSCSVTCFSFKKNCSVPSFSFILSFFFFCRHSRKTPPLLQICRPPSFSFQRVASFRASMTSGSHSRAAPPMMRAMWVQPGLASEASGGFSSSVP